MPSLELHPYRVLVVGFVPFPGLKPFAIGNSDPLGQALGRYYGYANGTRDQLRSGSRISLRARSNALRWLASRHNECRGNCCARVYGSPGLPGDDQVRALHICASVCDDWDDVGQSERAGYRLARNANLRLDHCRYGFLSECRDGIQPNC